METLKFIISTTSILFSVGLLFCCPVHAAKGKLTIHGTGDSQYLLQQVALAFERKYPDSVVEIPDSVGSSGGIKMLISGKADFARIGRPLKKNEQANNLTVLTFAKSPVVFVANNHSKKITNLSTEEILGIYDGSIEDWSHFKIPLGKIYPLTREQGDSSRSVLINQFPSFSKINFSTAKVLYTTPDMIKTLIRYKRTIGFAPMAAVLDTELNVISINGIYPSMQNVQDGKYKIVTPLSLVYKGKPAEIGKRFIDFLFGLEGMKVIFEQGAIPVEK